MINASSFVLDTQYFRICHSREGGNPESGKPDVEYIIHEALLREKRLKKWNRDWKINLIEENNPEWNDLYDDL